MNNLLTSRLYDNKNFYKAFEKDLKNARASILIESPFITTRRMRELHPKLSKLRHRGVNIVINTRNPDEHSDKYALQAVTALEEMQELDIKVLYTVKHHRKLAILDNKIIWEGSLNILSNNDSCEIMRRIESKELAQQLIKFLGVGVYL